MANHTGNSGKSKGHQSDRLESERLDLNNNLAVGSNGMNETANSAMNHLANKTNPIHNHQTGDLNGHAESRSPGAFNNQQFTNGPTTSPSSEPNSISNSRNSCLDETNSFSDSVTPDRPNVRSDRQAKDRTPMTSPIANQPGQLSQAMPSAESNQQGHSKNSQDNGLTSPANEKSADKIFKPHESQLINGIKVPAKRLRLKKIFGYNGSVSNNLHILSTDEIAYFVGVFVVLWDPALNVQRHYSEHTEDIVW